MDDFELASALFGTKRAEDGSADATRTVYARAVGDSSDGMVEVALGDDVVAEGEEWDDDGNQVDPGAGATVTIPTEAAVRGGDAVTVTLTGGVAKAPVVSGVVGGGDRMQADVDAAGEAAAEAQALARDSATIAISSSRGLVFKDGSARTVLSATVFAPGGTLIDEPGELTAYFGPTARIEWQQRVGEADEWGTILATDARISGGGFALSVSPEDIDTRCSYRASLITD